MRYIIPPACSGSAPRSPTSWTCPKNLQEKVPRRHPDQMLEPPQLPPFDTKEQWLYSELPLDVWAPHLISKAEQATLQRKPISFIRDLIFQSLPKAHGHRWGLERWSTGKSKALPEPSASQGKPHPHSELPWGQPKVLLHTLPELLPRAGFSCSPSQGSMLTFSPSSTCALKLKNFAFGFTRSVWQSALPSDPTHHLVVISWQLQVSKTRQIWRYNHKIDHQSLAYGVLVLGTLMNHTIVEHSVYYCQSLTSTDVQRQSTNQVQIRQASKSSPSRLLHHCPCGVRFLDLVNPVGGVRQSIKHVISCCQSVALWRWLNIVM